MDGQTLATWAGVAVALAGLLGIQRRRKKRPRIFVKETTARQVMEAVRALPPLQRKTFTRNAYVGRWVNWSGIVDSVSGPHPNAYGFLRHYLVTVTDEPGSVRSCRVQVPSSQLPTLELLREQETVVFEARITAVLLHTIHLDNGTITEYKPAASETG